MKKLNLEPAIGNHAKSFYAQHMRSRSKHVEFGSGDYSHASKVRVRIGLTDTYKLIQRIAGMLCIGRIGGPVVSIEAQP